MRARLIKLGAALAAIAALAVGGSALASAGQKAAPPGQPAPPTAVQSQSPSTPAVTPAETADPGEVAGGPDTDTLQQGDQSGVDTAEGPESAASESTSETGPSDGPGGYADTNPNADTEQQGQN